MVLFTLDPSVLYLSENSKTESVPESKKGSSENKKNNSKDKNEESEESDE